jgi:hypothetical protein
MSSLTKTPKRSKKTRRLGPVRVSRPDQYEAFDVNSKLECIRALIPLGLLHLQALSEEEVCTLVGEWYARKSPALPGRRYGSNLGSVQLAGKRLRSVSLACSAWLAVRSLYRPWATSEARGAWMRSCSSECCMGFPFGTMKWPRQRLCRWRLACRARPCLVPLRKAVPNSGCTRATTGILGSPGNQCSFLDPQCAPASCNQGAIVVASITNTISESVRLSCYQAL